MVTTLTVTPKVSLADEPVKIQLISDNPPSSVKLKLSLTNNAGINFESLTAYPVKSGDRVCLDLDRDRPVIDEEWATGATDVGSVLPMYPFWSLKATPDSLPRFVSNDARKHFDCHLQVWE